LSCDDALYKFTFNIYIYIREQMSRECRIKPAFHDADTDTDILADILARIVARMSACRSACHRNNFRKSRVSDVRM